MTATSTQPDFMTLDAYAEASSLPEAIRLNRAFMRHEIAFCHRHFTNDADEPYSLNACLEGWDEFANVLDAAECIWREEMAAALPRIAARIREEVPKQDSYGEIANCVESGDYSGMAC